MTRLQLRREAIHLTREQVALATHISVFRLGRYEREEAELSLRDAMRLARFFSCEVAEFGPLADVLIAPAR